MFILISFIRKDKIIILEKKMIIKFLKFLSYSFYSGPCNQVNCGYGNCLAIDHVSVCKCYSGFVLIGDICADVNECLQNPCHSSAMWVKLVIINNYARREVNS